MAKYLGQQLIWETRTEANPGADDWPGLTVTTDRTGGSEGNQLALDKDLILMATIYSLGSETN